MRLPLDCALDVQTICHVDQGREYATDFAQCLRSVDYWAIFPGKKIYVADLRVERKETIHHHAGGSECLAESRDQLSRSPVTHVEIAAFAESSAGLVIKAANA